MLVVGMALTLIVPAEVLGVRRIRRSLRIPVGDVQHAESRPEAAAVRFRRTA
jgi:hypothetical protein